MIKEKKIQENLRESAVELRESRELEFVKELAEKFFKITKEFLSMIDSLKFVCYD